MIAFLQGTLVARYADRVEVDVHGVGYEVFVSKRTLQDLPSPGKALTLKTYQHVREDAQLLFGFLRDAERQAFLLLLSVTGVGPKVALGIVSVLSPEDLYRAVLQDDHGSLRSVPGVGAKTAQHIVLEIKEKVARLSREGAIPQDVALGGRNAASQAVSDALQALLSLGYSDAEARRAVTAATGNLGEKATVEEILRISLKSIATMGNR